MYINHVQELCAIMYIQDQLCVIVSGINSDAESLLCFTYNTDYDDTRCYVANDVISGIDK